MDKGAQKEVIISETGQDVKMVRECDAKSKALRRKEGDANGSIREDGERKD